MPSVFELSRSQRFQQEFERAAIQRDSQNYRAQQREASQSQLSKSQAARKDLQETANSRNLDAQRSKVTEVSRVDRTRRTENLNIEKINNFKNISARAKSISLIEEFNPESTKPVQRFEPNPVNRNLSDSTVEKRTSVKAIQTRSLAESEGIKIQNQNVILETRNESKRNIQKNSEKLNRI